MKVRLNKSFYSKEAVESTIKAFSGVCKCCILNDEFELEISDSLDEQRVIDEFCNFVLGITKDRAMF